MSNAVKDQDQTRPIFPKKLELNSETITRLPDNHQSQDGTFASGTTIPGRPDIPLVKKEVTELLDSELLTPVLDEVAPRISWATVPASDNVDHLSMLKTKGREVEVIEDPKLHLVFYEERIYLKPIAEWMLNHAFWEHYLCPDEVALIKNTKTVERRKAALGFLRTYFHLVKYRSDFDMASSLNLIPENIKWDKFAPFIKLFGSVKDECVSARYQLGQVRLTRLNLAVFLYRPKSSRSRFYYQEPHWHYRSTSTYVQRLYPPLLFLFGSLSVLLSSFQLVLNRPKDVPPGSVFSRIVTGCHAIAYVLIILVFALYLFIPVFYAVVIINQLAFGRRVRKRIEKEKGERAATLAATIATQAQISIQMNHANVTPGAYGV